MKRTLAILFSLLLASAQVMFSGPATGTTTQEASCTCCACGGSGCCLSGSLPADDSPLPAPPARTGLENGVSFSATTFVAWTLPLLEAESPPFAIEPPKSERVPLFTRHCALLI